MATSSETPWSEAEKVALLTEILKDARIPSATLLNIITEARIEPRWEEIPLPMGRSLRSCQNAFQALKMVPPRMSSGSVLQSPFSHPAAHAAGVALTSSRKRGQSFRDPTTPGNRALQPRPSGIASLNGELAGAAQASPGDGAVEPPRKKRGRPSRAELEARAQAAAEAAARGEVYPPAKSPRTPKPPKSAERGSAGGAAEMSEFGTGLVPATTMPSSAHAGTSAAAGSTGKKRRGRPTKAEAQAKRVILEAAVAAHQAQSMDPEHETLEDDSAVAGLMEQGAEEIEEGDEPEVTMTGSMDVQSSATL